MRKYLKYYTTKALRFRRWSRKAFASFVSVGREVTIGSLGASVVERLFAKTTLLTGGVIETPAHSNEGEEDGVLKGLEGDPFGAKGFSRTLLLQFSSFFINNCSLSYDRVVPCAYG